MPQTTILILAANPKDTNTLRLDQEIRDIREGIRLSQHRDNITIESRLALRPQDLQRALLDTNPQIVHFCGHGIGQPTLTETTAATRKLNSPTPQISSPEGLALEDNQGNTTLVSTEALTNLFSLFKDTIQCIVLNACYADNQAKAIAQHIPYVIGMNQAIGDKAAIEFAVSFYDAIGAGRNVSFAFELAKNAIQLAGIPEHLTPVLRSNPNTSLSSESEVIPQLVPSKSQLTPGKRNRLEQKLQSLQSEYQLRHEKLTMLRKDASIEAGTAVKFQLEQQIENETQKITDLEQEIDRIEQELIG